MGKCENAKIIKLRKLEPSDLPFLYQWENDASVWADGANHNPLSQQDLRDYLASTTGDIYKDGQLRLVIFVCAETIVRFVREGARLFEGDVHRTAGDG